MKPILYLFLAIPFFTYGQKYDQFMIAAQGDFNASPFMTLSWTLGDNFIETVSFENHIYTQGFQQPFLNIQQLPTSQFSRFKAEIFPNPSDGILTINVINSERNYKLEVLDVTGRILYLSEKNNDSMELDLSSYGSGIYFIRLSNTDNSRISLHKIVKL